MSTTPASPAPVPPIDPVAHVQRRLGRPSRRRWAVVALLLTILAVWAFWWFLSAHILALWSLQAGGARVQWDPLTDWQHGGVTHVNFVPFSMIPPENGVQDEGLKPIENLVGLESLHLAHCVNLTDAGLAVLRTQPRLRILDLTMTPSEGSRRPRLTGAVVDHLVTLNALEDLALAGLPMTDADVARLKDLPRLKYLNLSQTNITDATLTLLADGFPALEEVHLEQTGVSDEAVAALALKRPALILLHPAVEPPPPPGLEAP